MNNTLIKLYQPNCAPCEVLARHLEERGIPHDSINAQEHPEKTIEFQVRRVPTLVIVNADGEMVDALRGYKGLDEVDAFLEGNGIDA